MATKETLSYKLVNRRTIRQSRYLSLFVGNSKTQPCMDRSRRHCQC